jgi:hypothetical protein
LAPLLARALLQPGETSAAFRRAVAWDGVLLQQALVG